MRPITKLLSQLEQVERATPLARSEEGKISVGLLALYIKQLGLKRTRW